MSAAPFEVLGLSIRDQAGQALVQDVGFTVRPGETLVVIGETGSGKSLIAQALMGILPPGLSAEGVMRRAGTPDIPLSDPRALSGLWARETMLLPQEPATALDPTMRVGRQLRLPGARTAEALNSVLDALALDRQVANDFPFALSGGMAQRVLVGCVMESPARLVIADEPTKGLDSGRIERVVALLRGLADAHRALVVITHDLAVARGLGGAVLVLFEGRVVEAGPAADVLGSPRHAYTAAWLAADPARWPRRDAAPAQGQAVLAGQGLAFAWPGGRTLFRDVSLAVRPGDVVAVMGPALLQRAQDAWPVGVRQESEPWPSVRPPLLPHRAASAPPRPGHLGALEAIASGQFSGSLLCALAHPAGEVGRAGRRVLPAACLHQR